MPALVYFRPDGAASNTLRGLDVYKRQDDNGAPTAVPPLAPRNLEEKQRFEAARLRRELRQEMERRHDEIKRETTNEG